jgi:hypothetical protein
VPDLVLARHGPYVLAQGTSGWEVRDDRGQKRRSRVRVAAVLLALAGVLHLELRHPVAVPMAMLGAFLAVSALTARSKVLVLGDTELRYGPVGHPHDRRGAWPRSQVAKVVVQQFGSTPRGVDRARRPGPFYLVRVQGTDQQFHPARFTLRTRESAFELASAIAERLGVGVETGATEIVAVGGRSSRNARSRHSTKR